MNILYLIVNICNKVVIHLDFNKLYEKCKQTDDFMKKQGLKQNSDYLITQYDITNDSDSIIYLKIQFVESSDIIKGLESLGWVFEKRFYTDSGVLSSLYEGNLSSVNESRLIAKMIFNDL